MSLMSLTALELGRRIKNGEVTAVDAAGEALAQIERMQYAAALEQKGILTEKIRKYGFAFEGKEVLIKSNSFLP